MLQNLFRIYLFLLLIILLGCDRGGNILIVGSISGPNEVSEGTTVEFRVDAEGDSGITYFWVVNPTEFGILSNPNSKSTTYTAPEIDSDFEIVIRGVVNSDNDGPVIRSTDVTIVDIGEPDDGGNGDNGDDDDPPPPINHPPTAAAHVSTVEVEQGVEVQFFDDSTDPDGNDDIVLWEWDFTYDPDDGFQVESEEQEPVHVYDEEGTYSIQLRVVDSGGISDMLDSPIEIVVEEIFIFNPQELARIGFGFRITDIEMRGDYVFMIAPGYGFNVVNISNPDQPYMVTSLELEHRFDWLVIDGPYAYALGEDNAVVQIINIEDPEAPYAVNNIQLTGTGMAIAVQDGYAYITLEYAGVWIIDVDPPEDAHVIQNVDLTSKCFDIDVDGEYAVVVSRYPYPSVMHILDIDPPETAYLVNTIESGSLPQCVKLKQGYAFICLDQYLKVYDIDPPESAHFVSQLKIHLYSGADIAMVDEYIYVLDSAFYIFHFNYETPWLSRIATDMSSVDGSVLTTDGNLVCSSVYKSLFVHEIDVNSPSVAPLRGLLHPMNVQDIAVSDDQLFIVTDDLIVFDVSNPEFPQFLLNWADFSGSQYKRIVVDHDFAYMLDSPDNPYLKIVDISSLNDPFTVEEFQILGNKGFGDLVFEDGYLYITSNRGWLITGGLEILDVDPPESTGRIMDVTINQTTVDVEVYEGYAYVTGWKNEDGGVYTIDVDPPEETKYVNYYQTIIPPRSLAISDDLIYVACHMGTESRLEILRISTTGELEQVNYVTVEGHAERIEVGYPYAYIANLQGLQVFDVRDPQNVDTVYSMNTRGNCIDLVLDEPYVYLADDQNGVYVIKLW